MLKIVVYLFFIITGGTVGFLYSPTIVEMLNLDYVEWTTSPYIGLVVFAIIFFILSYFIVDYIVGFLSWFDEVLIKVSIIVLFFVCVCFIYGLVYGCFILFYI